MASSLTQALRTAQSGLLVNQSALDAVANNIANVNTKGYSRKTVNLEQRVVDGTGAGVQLSELTRQIDEGLLKSLRLELGNFNSLNVQRSFYDRLQDLFGAPADNSSISHIVSDLTAALESLSVAPNKTLELSEVLRQAQNTTIKLQDMSTTIQELRQQADNSVADIVTEINALVTRIGNFNDTLVRNSTTNQDVTDLKDQRDQAIDRLAELIDIRYFVRSDGDVVVFTSNGRTLVDNIPATLTHRAASTVSATSTHAEGNIGGIFVGTEIAGNDITDEIKEGQLKGLVELRDSVLTDLQSQIDEMAAGIRDTFNQVHNSGPPTPAWSP